MSADQRLTKETGSTTVVAGPTARGTADSDLMRSWAPSETRSTMILTEDVGLIRGRVDSLGRDVHDTHTATHSLEWRVRSTKRGKEAPTELLAELSKQGFSWRGVAQLLGVTNAAVQKWRRGEGVSGENRRVLAGLVAACDLLAAHFYVQDIASWLETPLLADAPVTPEDLWLSSRVDLIFEAASGYVDPEKVLDDFDSEWRQRYKTDFEVVTGSDGARSIQAKG